MDYFISDTHFGHANIMKFERNQFNNIKEHDNFIFELIENKVKLNDTLYHLGDFGSLDDDILNRWNNLPCKTVLIRGNHDKSIGKLKNVFDEVHNEPIFYNKRILLCHEPLPVTEGTLCVHGHLHNANLDLPNYLNISIHMINYKIVNAKFLENKKSKLRKDNFKFKHEWFASHYKFNK